MTENTSTEFVAPMFKRPVFRPQNKDGYPQLPEQYATISIALTTFSVAYSGLFGIWSILLFYALWLPHISYKGRFILRLSKDIVLPLGLAAACILSVFWSDYPSITIRAALEFTSMAVCSIIATRITSLRSFIKGTVIGFFIVLVVTISKGGYALDPFTGEYAFVGLLGSKNQVGFAAEIEIFMAALMFFNADGRTEKIIYSIIPLLLSGASLYLSHSATSVVSLGATMLACFVAYRLTKFSRPLRAPVLFAITLFGVLLAAIALALGWQKLGFTALGKDSTLTGRTYIWSEGLKYGMEHPFLGHGFYAFWVPGQPGAEKIWFKFGIYNRTGFHFHDLFIQAFVDMGLIGVTFIVLIITSTCIASFRYILRNGPDLTAFLCIGISIMFLIRASVEVDMWGAFGIGILLFFSLLPRIAIRSTTNNNLPKPSRKLLMS